METKGRRSTYVAMDVPPGARAGGPGGGSLAPDLAPVWRQTDGRQTHEHERRQRRTLTLYRNYAFTEQRAILPPSFITRSLFPSCAVDEPGSSTRNMQRQRQQRGVSFAPRPVFFMGLAALGPPGTWRDRQVTPT
eukprot:scaffold2501_cov113-Isochrysis_galbana.AAC.7